MTTIQTRVIVWQSICLVVGILVVLIAWDLYTSRLFGTKVQDLSKIQALAVSHIYGLESRVAACNFVKHLAEMDSEILIIQEDDEIVCSNIGIVAPSENITRLVDSTIKGGIKSFVYTDSGRLSVSGYKHVFESNGGIVEVSVLHDLGEFYSADLRNVTLIFIPLFLAASILGTIVLTLRFYKDLNGVISEIMSISLDRLDRPSSHASKYKETDSLLRAGRRAKERLAEGIKRVHAFSSAASHELRTPLAVMAGEINVALRWGGGVPPEIKTVLESCSDEIKRMERITSSLLMLAKGQVGELQLNESIVEVIDLMQNLGYQAQRLAEENGQRFDFNHSKNVPLFMIGDDVFLRQLLLNLIKNAIFYSPEGSLIELSVAGEQDGSYVVFEVSDNGEGIPEEDLAHIFESFYRSDKARTRKLGGTGLGLAICKMIAEAHGGRIEVESKVGIGTKFKVVLPTGAQDDELLTLSGME